MHCNCVVFGDAHCCNVLSQHGYLRRYSFLRARLGLVPSNHTDEGPCNVKIKTGGQLQCRVPSLKGLTVVIKDETGEIPWGRMFGVQKWVRAPRLPTGVFNGGLQVPASFLDFILDARITGWLVLDLHGGYLCWIPMASFGQFSGFQ